MQAVIEGRQRWRREKREVEPESRRNHYVDYVLSLQTM